MGCGPRGSNVVVIVVVIVDGGACCRVCDHDHDDVGC